MHTIDSLITQLQDLKAAGVPGDTPVAIPCADNNGRPGYVQRLTTLSQAAVSKPEYERGFGVCKLVFTRGIPVLVLRGG